MASRPGGAEPSVSVRVLVNGETETLPTGTTLADVVATVAGSGRGIAVALDREVVPRSSWPDVVVEQGAVVEVVTAAAGG